MALNEHDLREYSLKDFRLHLSSIVGEVAHGKKRVRVTSYGKTAGYFISEEELAYLDAIQEEHENAEIERILAKAAEEARAADSSHTPQSEKEWWTAQIELGMEDLRQGRFSSGEESYARVMKKLNDRISQQST